MVPQHLKHTILQLHHCSQLGAHLGVWPKHFLSFGFTFIGLGCPLTQIGLFDPALFVPPLRDPMYEPVPPLHPHNISHQPFIKVCIDHIMALPTVGAAGYRYIAVCTDYFSRYFIDWPTVDVTAETFAKEFFQHVVCVHGAPAEIVSDNGPCCGLSSLPRSVGLTTSRTLLELVSTVRHKDFVRGTIRVLFEYCAVL